MKATTQRTIKELKAEREQARRAALVAYHEMWDKQAEQDCLNYINAITQVIEELNR